MNEWWIVGAIGIGALFLLNNNISHHAPLAPARATAGAQQLIPGLTIYKPTGRKAAIANPAGQNQQITYASSGKGATSHRVDTPVQFPAHEATVRLAWPANCTGGGHPELAIKHWGPNHTDSSCCYCYGSFAPAGGNLQMGFGGEGPHPNTTTFQTVTKTIPFQPGKQYGFKSIIWPLAGGGAHQEIYYDDGSGFKLGGMRNTPTCGKSQTSRAISPNAQVEFRIDCANVTYSGTDVTEILPGNPLGKIVPALGHVGYAYPGFYTWGPDIGLHSHRQIRYTPGRWATHHGALPPDSGTDLDHSC